MFNARVFKTKSHTASAEKTKHFFLLSLLLFAAYFVIAPATVRAASAVIYLQSDLGPTDNPMWANQSDFAPICNGTGGNPRLPGLDLARKFSGSAACPRNTDSNRLSTEPSFVFLVDDTSALSSHLTTFLQSQNLLQEVSGRRVIAPGTRTFQIQSQSINILFVGEMAYRQGGSNAATWFTTLNALPSTPMVASASAVHWIDKCNQEIPVPVPSFSCIADGAEVPKTITNGECKHPEALYNRCVHKSRLGRLAKGNTQNVDIIFSCRKARTGDHAGDTGKDFYDIAVIQHHRTTGKTCFYQYIGSGDDRGDNIPAPATATGKTFWGAHTTNYCTRCHTNGPFVRTPHYWNVKDSTGNRILPSIRQITKYEVVHNHFEVFDVSKSSNACLSCHSHNVGAYKEGGSLLIGQVNELAAGKIKSLSTGGGGDSPTTSKFHDFMARRAGGSANAKAALQELEDCLATPTPTGCTVTQVTHSPPAPATSP